ncbi:flagellar basal body-associated FliL family protein [Peteryoungia desertarenae]|uniref:Flagellar basal body-associated FliL family protein n=1 Tax=Peteryoungia desertarenae TaxID=1813451 RepID=A0ABX6QMC8_9HYPH|nr:flagellar basal body-associated FliL family protein [Peteryoungia desertarenae]QLF69390.1 flagellar basal body-associated FliL family protein [Peteryoungia desertarenae]
MVKILAAGIWVCLVTLGAVYFSISMATAPAEVAEEQATPLQLVPGESITIPLIADGAVNGYFLTRISFMMNADKLKNQELPITELMTDKLFTLLVGNEMADITRVSSFDVEAFREQIKTSMNEQFGEGMVERVLVEQLDYVSREAARRAADGETSGPMERTQFVEGEQP